MNQRKSSTIATVSIFFATMLVIHLLSSTIFSIWPMPIKPTLVHIPVIVASIIYGPRIGAILGALMGVISIITNTIIQIPLSSYLFSPFVENGNFASLIVALVPRILIGLTPYYVYKLFSNKVGLIMAGAIGSLTNTIFVLSAIFFFFSSAYDDNITKMLASVLSGNSIAEMLIASFLTLAIVPRLLKLKQ